MVDAVEEFKRGFYFSDEFVGSSSWNGYEHNCLFVNAGQGRFLDVAFPLGADSTRDGRGVATPDLDGDGRRDLVIASNAAPPVIYLNRLTSGHWIELELVGRQTARDAVGARVEVRLAAHDDRPAMTLTRWVEAGSGYAAQSSFPVHFGLGSATAIDAVTIHWPGGDIQEILGTDIAMDRRTRVEEAVQP